MILIRNYCEVWIAEKRRISRESNQGIQEPKADALTTQQTYMHHSFTASLSA